MATDSANLSTLTFGTVTVGKVTSIQFGGSAAEIDVSALTDTAKKYIAGQPNNKITFEVIGNNTSMIVGNTGAVTVAWNDGTSSSITKTMVSSYEVKGGVDQAITCSVGLVPTP
jgi:hypothetical protein